MLSVTVGFIGAGQMATALGKGFVAAELVAPEAVLASDPSPAAQQAFAAAIPGARSSGSNREVAGQADLLILAVKPAHLDAALDEIAADLNAETLVVSIVAGVTLAELSQRLPAGTPLVRVMPNTPCCLGWGASAYSVHPTASTAQGQLVGQLMAAVGLALEVPENLLDAVTGLSGSGPAFVYTVVEALSDGGVLMGLPRPIAAQLAAQTVAGAAQMIQQTGEHPATLRDRVSSPGGTTIAGLEALETGGLRATLMKAVRAATQRSTELRAARDA